MLAAINAVFSAQGVNVRAQVLQTRGALGYVVMDVDEEASDRALAALREVPGTIRARVLF